MSSRATLTHAPTSPALAANVLGAGLTAAAAAYRFLAPQPEHLRALACVWVVASVLYLLACGLALRTRHFPVGTVLLWALVMRALSLGQVPGLTTDHHRYLWDGKVQLAGVNPYRYAPNAPELKALRDENWKDINFRSIPTIYPPTSQMVFLLVRAAGGREALRLVFLAAEVLAWVCLLALLRRAGRPDGDLVFFAWCPLAVVEVAFNLHQDILGVALLLAAITLGVASSGVALALSVLAKGYSVLLLPVLLKLHRKRFAPAFVLAGAAAVLPYVGAGRAMFGGLGEYLGGWRGHGTVYPALVRLFSLATDNPDRVATAGCALALLAVLALVTVRVKEPAELPAACGVMLGSFILVSPIVFPWYVLWVAAFLPLTRSLPWAGLSCSTLAAYSRFLHEAPMPGVGWAEYGPLVVTFVASESRRLLRGHPCRAT